MEKVASSNLAGPTMNRIIALVGMPGSGKSEVAQLFEASGFAKIRFGDVTEEEIKKRGLEVNEINERLVREELRSTHGMEAYAKLNLPKIEKSLKKSNVIVDGMYSMEEYVYLKSRLGKNMFVVAVYASPETRYDRLGKRKMRPLTREQSESRDISELKNLNKGGPIALADFTITNEGPLTDLKRNVEKILEISEE